MGGPFPVGAVGAVVDELMVGVGPERSTVPPPVGSPRKSAFVSTPVSSDANPFAGGGCVIVGATDRSGKSGTLEAESGHC